MPGMPGDDLIGLIDQDRVGEAELGYVRLQGGQLSRRVFARVVPVGDKRCGGTIFDREPLSRDTGRINVRLG